MITTPKLVHWFEISVTDIVQAAALYEAMLDTKLEHSVFEGIPHAVLSNPDRASLSGTLIADPARPPTRGGGTVLYLRATDGVQRCVARALEAGAKLVQPPTQIGPHGTIALIEDLDGNVVGLHEEPRS